jgi:hypothetical protein
MNTSDKSPTADVYAADTSLPTAPEASGGSIVFFKIEADAQPGTFARIANMLNIANTAPSRVILKLNENDETLSIYVEVGVGLSTAQSIQEKLVQLTDVIHVDLGILPPNSVI